MKPVLEGLLFLVGEEGIDEQGLANILEITKEEVKELIENLRQDYESEERGLTIKKLGGTMPEKMPTPRKSIKDIEHKQKIKINSIEK